MKKTLFLLMAMLAGCAIACMAGKPKAKHVVFIGLDGWGAYSVEKAEMPTVKRLMGQGCYTLQKRTVSPSSSAPNWASLFMGAATELHGYTTWGSKTPEIPSRMVLKHNIFPTIFQVYRDACPTAEIGVLYEWEGIKYLVDTLSVSHYALAPDYEQHPSALCEMAEEYIRTKHPSLLAVCFDNPDHVGHQEGHDTPAYYAKLKELDGYIARIIAAVEAAGMSDNTVFIITSDHGGTGKGHGGITLQEMETPFIIAGKNIRQRGEFHESMMQYDVTAIMAYILGLKQPQVWTGRPLKQLFRK